METITGTPKELSMQLSKLEQNKVYELKRYRPIRGTQANRYFHKLINELARYNRSLGHTVSDEDMKIAINTSYGTLKTDDNGNTEYIVTRKGTEITEVYPYAVRYKSTDTADYWKLYKRTSELDSHEFWQLIKGLETECKDVGIKTLDDIEFERMMTEYDKEMKGE